MILHLVSTVTYAIKNFKMKCHLKNRGKFISRRKILYVTVALNIFKTNQSPKAYKRISQWNFSYSMYYKFKNTYKKVLTLRSTRENVTIRKNFHVIFAKKVLSLWMHLIIIKKLRMRISSLLVNSATRFLSWKGSITITWNIKRKPL